MFILWELRDSEEIIKSTFVSPGDEVNIKSLKTAVPLTTFLIVEPETDLLDPKDLIEIIDESSTWFIWSSKSTNANSILLSYLTPLPTFVSWIESVELFFNFYFNWITSYI